MGFVHMDKRALDGVQAARSENRPIDDLTASMIVNAFTGSWATCWFAETGNFAVSTECLPSTTAGEVYGGLDPVEEMDRHLWRWMDGPDGFEDPWDEDKQVPVLREEMRKYMAARWQGGAGECGPVEGWQRKPFA